MTSSEDSPSRRTWWRAVRRYVVAVLSVAVASGLALFLQRFDLRESFFLLAIAMTVWYAGTGPGLFATVLSIVALDYLFLDPVRSVSLDLSRLPYFIVFTTFALVISWFSATRRRVETELRQAHDELEAKVAERTQELRRSLASERAALAESMVAQERIREADAALREQASLLDLTHDAIFVRDMADVITYWNRAAEQFYGWTASEALGQVSHELMHTVFPAPLEQMRRELLAAGRWEGELFHTRKDGTRAVVMSRWSLQRDAEDQPRGILEINNDVTERRRAEYLAGHVFDVSPDGIFIIGPDYRYQRANGAVERRWQIPAARIVGMRVDEVVGAAAFVDVKAALDRCFAGQQASVVGWFRTPAGQEYLATTYSPLRPDSERVDAVLGISRDLTEHARASEALQQAQAELAHVTRVTTLGELAASIAHEVNQPLAAIVADANASLNWLASAQPDLASVREALDAIVKDGHRAAAVIQRIRDLATKRAPQKMPLGLNDVIQDVVPLVGTAVRSHDVSMRIDLTPALPAVLADRIQLQQVLINLVMNGIEGMASVADRPRELVIRSKMYGADEVLLAVQDAGVGIDPDKTDQLFNPFFTTKPGGMGMGLSISRSIVEAHGGRLWATPNAEHGATFYCALPVMD